MSKEQNPPQAPAAKTPDEKTAQRLLELFDEKARNQILEEKDEKKLQKAARAFLKKLKQRWYQNPVVKVLGSYGATAATSSLLTAALMGGFTGGRPADNPATEGTLPYRNTAIIDGIGADKALNVPVAFFKNKSPDEIKNMLREAKLKAQGGALWSDQTIIGHDEKIPKSEHQIYKIYQALLDDTALDAVVQGVKAAEGDLAKTKGVPVAYYFLTATKDKVKVTRDLNLDRRADGDVGEYSYAPAAP